MPAFATVDDLESHLGKQFSVEEALTAQQALNMASEIIRGWTNQTLDRVVDDQINILGSGTGVLFLPELPVVSVSEVEINSEVVPASGYHVDIETGALIRRWMLKWPRPGINGDFVTVTYTHGFNPIPLDIKYACLVLAAVGVQNPAGLRQMSLGTYMEMYNEGGVGSDVARVEIQDLRRVLSRYRRLVAA